VSQPGDRRVPSALVVGAGLAGMTAAFYLAECGARTTLVDRAPHLGGAFLLLDHTFTTDSCGLCLALPRQPSYCPTLASELHPRIDTLPRTTLDALEGESGAFVATLHHAPRFVDPGRCDGCGACATVCPVPRPFSSLMLPGEGAAHDGQQKAIYPPPPRAVPAVYAIDAELCTRCGACEAICPQAAIDLGAAPSESRVEADVVLLAPGLAPFDAARAVEYGWGRCANVVTSLEFERLLNGGGQRPRLLQQRRPPRRVAFIQCVGSRSERLGRPYCAASCCMITAKQVRLLKQAAPEAEVTVYSMDVRAAGKGYERYVEQTAALPGVTYRWGRPAAVHEIPPEGAGLRVLAPGGEDVFDMVVLAVGLGPPEGVRELAARAGIALDEDGFVLAGDEGPGSTTRPGVYATGCAVAPADVPEVVTQAAAAAALAAAALPARRGAVFAPDAVVAPTVLTPASSTPSPALDEPPRVGVFLCTCRGTLEGALDYSALGTGGRAVAHVQRVAAACEPAGLAAIERAAVEQNLNRIVVAGCPQRLYAGRFEALMDRLCLPRHLLARANIREGAAWVPPLNPPRQAHGGEDSAPSPGRLRCVHRQRSEEKDWGEGLRATAAARGEIQMAIAGLRETPEAPPLSPLPTTVGRKAHGGEDSAAKPTGEGWGEGESRVLVLGGGLAGMTAAVTLASLGIEADLVEREAHLGGNLRDRLHTLEGLDAQALLAETLARLERSPVRVWTGAELVGWSGVRGAFAAEIRCEGGEAVREDYGALIVATGAAPARPGEAMAPYRYGVDARVITQTELEHRLAEDAAFRARLAGASVVMVQCVGSRDEAHPYCSRVCCQAAIKNALTLKALDPAIEVSILYRDVRTLGLQERFYQHARRLGVHLFRYEPPELPVVKTGDSLPDRLRLTVHDLLYDQRVTLAADWVVLSTGIAPIRADNRKLADLLGVPLDDDGFLQEAHPKLRPTDLALPGLHLCGLAYGPRTIEETLAQARAAALRAALDVAPPPELRDDVATVVEKLCSYCGLCVIHCPYGARVLDEEHRCAAVIDHLCQGCGACVAVCPNDASRQPALDPARLLAMVDAVMDQEGIL